MANHVSICIPSKAQTGALSPGWKWVYRLQVRPDQALPGVRLGMRSQALGRGARLTRESEMFKALETRGPREDRSLKGCCPTGSTVPRGSHLPSHCGWCSAARRWSLPWCSLQLELLSQAHILPRYTVAALPILQKWLSHLVDRYTQVHAPSACIPVEVACWHPGAQHSPRWQEEGGSSWLDFF